MAGAVVCSDSVPADMLTSPVVGSTLVLVSEEYCGEPVLLDRVIREELQPETVSLRCNNLEY